MNAWKICSLRRWGHMLPTNVILFRESDDIYEYRESKYQLYSNQRIAYLDLTPKGSWEVDFVDSFDLTAIRLNAILMKEYSLYNRYLQVFQKKWDYVSRVIYKTFGKRYFFDLLKAITKPLCLVDKMNSKQKRFAKKRLLTRAFSAWKSWTCPPAMSGKWTNFPRSGWFIVNDTHHYVSIIARSYSPSSTEIQILREFCSVCQKPAIPRKDRIAYYSCGHCIHVDCLDKKGVQIHYCVGNDSGSDPQNPFTPLPTPSNINLESGMYVLDRTFYIVGVRGEMWRITAPVGRGKTVYLSQLFNEPSSTHIWRIASIVTNWRRRTVAMVERRQFSVCYLHIQMMQVAWNEFGQDIRQFHVRLESISGLKRWREKVGMLSGIVSYFCDCCTSKTVRKSPYNIDKQLIRADMNHFGGVYNAIYKLYAHIFGENDTAEWCQDLVKYTKPNMFTGLKQKQLHFQVLVREILFYMEEMIARSDIRLSIDRGLDLSLYRLNLWGACFHRIGYPFMSEAEKRKTNNFFVNYRMILNDQVGKVRFAFKWNTQQLFYKSDTNASMKNSKNEECCDDLIFQMGEVCGLDIKSYNSTAIHFICVGMDNLVKLVEKNTKLPIQHWLKQIYH